MLHQQVVVWDSSIVRQMGICAHTVWFTHADLVQASMQQHSYTGSSVLGLYVQL